MTHDSSSELLKTRKHLELLRQEHLKLQTEFTELQFKYDELDAWRKLKTNSLDDDGTVGQQSFVTKLVKTVAELFEKDLYSDLTIHLDGHQLRAHRFVLASRSDGWTNLDLATVDHIEFNDMSFNIGYTLLKWVYTDYLDPKLGDSFLLDLMNAAQKYKLTLLLRRCEQMLVGRLDVKNCIKFYQVAEEIDAPTLKDQCSQLITTRWDDFTASDFVSMSAQLLYKMLRSKVKFPLHSAIRLSREDIVFLYLIEYDAQLEQTLNMVDEQNMLPLSVALSASHESLARTLVSHGADVNARDGSDRTLFIVALQQGDPFACNFLLENGADVCNVQSITGHNALHVVSSMCLSEMSNCDQMTQVVDTLLSNSSIDPNLQDINGKTALHLALESQNEILVNRLLDRNDINLNIKDTEQQTPLAIALKINSNLNLARKLVDKGADVNVVRDSDGYSLLQDNIESLANALFLLEHNADVHLTTNKGETALHLACHCAKVELIDSLLSAGADPNVQTNDDLQSVLHMAVSTNDIDVVQAILTYFESNESKGSIDFGLVDSEGRTALNLALSNESIEIGAQLIKCGANVNLVDNNGWSLLLNAIQLESEQVALFLIRSGADTSLKTPDLSLTCLQLAVDHHLLSVVKALCRAGADMNVRDNDGLPPIWTALVSEQEDVASALVEYGCDADCWGQGPSGCQQTLLHRAIDENNENIACFLVRSFCDPNACRRPGSNGEGDEEAHTKETPLHMCSTWGLEETVNALIEHGANVNAQDVEGKTPVHVAVANHHDQILKLLLRSADISLSVRDRKGLTPFASAMQSKNNKAAKAILDREPRAANQMNNKGYNLLHTAVKQCDIESVLFLLSVNVHVNIPTQDSSRLTAVHLACEGGDEMIMRNLILAGGDVKVINSRKQTPLHLAAWNDKPQLCTIMLENRADCDALDDALNNALHVAVHKGSVGCVRVLLTESNIDAVALNMKGQTPLHVLGQQGRDNAATILDLFLETMHEYPVDKADNDGNTMLLYAYMNGNAQLCKAAVRTGLCLGSTNNQGISIFSYETPTKQLLFRLLDQLAKEPKWAEGDFCSECSNKFSFTVRKHHCRHCGRVLCAKCSERQMPIIKYDLQKPVRVCDVCYDVLTLGTQ